METTDAPELDIGSRLIYHAPLGGTLRCRVTGALANGKVTFGKADNESLLRFAAPLSAFRLSGDPSAPWEVHSTESEITDDARF
ncbi:MAG: hypothetical protein HGA45_34930 [Chloroflexales bacterium]|nr:hypothetical protein [Chloroflexales bacterium]